MIFPEDLEEILPCPVKIELCGNVHHFNYAIRDSLKKLLQKHNEKYDTKIDYLPRFFRDPDDNKTNIAWGEYIISVGGNIVHDGKAPTEDDETKNEIVFYKTILPVAEGVLNIWHDKIIEIQEENKKKIKKYEEEGYDELLYSYYNLHSDRRAFIFLKRLATRYPKSDYMRKLRSVYRHGAYGCIKANEAMLKKITRKRGVEYF